MLIALLMLTSFMPDRMLSTYDYYALSFQLMNLHRLFAKTKSTLPLANPAILIQITRKVLSCENNCIHLY